MPTAPSATASAAHFFKIASPSHKAKANNANTPARKPSSQRADHAPAPPAPIALGLLVRDPRDESGIFVERPLPFDQAARDIDGHRLHDVRYLMRLAEDVPPVAAVLEETIAALVAPHGDMGHGVDPQSRVSPRLTPRSNRSASGGISANSGSSASLRSSRRASSASRKSTTTLVRSAASTRAWCIASFRGESGSATSAKRRFCAFTPHVATSVPSVPLSEGYTNG